MLSYGFDNGKVARSAYEDNDEDVDEGGCWLRSCYKLRDDVSALLLWNYLLLSGGGRRTDGRTNVLQAEESN